MALFTTTAYPLSSLVEDIDQGKIGLPDIQRPFVWPNVNVRNLFDSLYRGYPVGYLLFWETGAETVTKTIGAQSHQKPPSLAIVDGQQRLTSLFAVIRAKEVVRANFKKERIRIAFNPLQARFEVCDASIVKDSSYIPDISVLWRPETNLFAIAAAFISKLQAVRTLSPDEISQAQNAISRLRNLPDYTFTALALAESVEAETVAEIFVRINGQGKQLNQADFILTLMSVFWDIGRTELEQFARAAATPGHGVASPYNHFIKPSPDQMLRVTVGLGMKRARLESVYGLLRGRDATTGKLDKDKREAQFDVLRIAQIKTLNLANWHYFLSALTMAGYRHESMVSSQTAIIYSYVLYLLGIVDYNLPKDVIRQAIAEFFFMAAMTGRYSNSPETKFEFDIAQLRVSGSGNEYLSKLRQISAQTLTNDFWEVTLPTALATSASRSPSRFAYQASLILLEARALYSPLKIADMVDPAVKGPKATFEQHHLFPRGYLSKLGIADTRVTNQIANFAVVEWPINVKISDQAPANYAPALDAKIPAADREKVLYWHALPPMWWTLPYDEFLVERRARMALVVKEAYKRLCGSVPVPVQPSVAELLAGGEGGNVEFKSTLRVNLHTAQHDEKMHLAVLKSIAGFFNARGGTIMIGVADDGKVIGLSADGFQNEDKMGLHLVNLVRDRIGSTFVPYMHIHFQDQDGERVLLIQCENGPKAAFVKDGATLRFYVRGGNATAELVGPAVTDYARARFN